MLLSHITIAGLNGPKHILIEDGKISAVETIVGQGPGTMQLVFDNAIAFPGLINSHDHLDFNLFPPLGNGFYNNYKEWGTDIHIHNKALISRVLAVPQQLRARWGVYKNLINGITAVAHHGKRLNMEQDLITVCQDADSFHSVSGEKGWRLKLLNPFRRHRPVVIHIGEGTSPDAFAEINELIRWNIFRRELTGIHAVAMNEKQAASFRSLVWCPASNFFLLNKTAAIDLLKKKTRILFGTDSTLSASWNIWEHLRLARAQQMISDTELFDMLTIAPAEAWGLKQQGSIMANQWADIVVAKPPAGATGWDAFYAINPENILLVLHKGRIQLFDSQLYDQLSASGQPLNDFYRIHIEGAYKYVRGNLPALVKEIQHYNPGTVFPFSAED